MNGHFGVVASLLLKYQHVVLVSPLELSARVLVRDILQLQAVGHLSLLESLVGVVLEKCRIFAIEEVVLYWQLPDLERPEVFYSDKWPGNMHGAAGSIGRIFLRAIFVDILWRRKFFVGHQDADVAQTIFCKFYRDVF